MHNPPSVQLMPPQAPAFPDASPLVTTTESPSIQHLQGPSLQPVFPDGCYPGRDAVPVSPQDVAGLRDGSFGCFSSSHAATSEMNVANSASEATGILGPVVEQAGGAAASVPNTTSAVFGSDVPYYETLWSVANPQLAPTIPGSAAAAFLELSGLSRSTLHQVWAAADVQNTGHLNFEAFCVACRIIAHLQNGATFSPILGLVEPPTRPLFITKSEQGRFNPNSPPFPTAAEDHESNTPPLGFMLDFGTTPSGLSPASISGQIPPSFFDSTQPELSGFAPPSYDLSDTDASKYLSLYQSLPQEPDGRVSEQDAKAVMRRSGLSEADLCNIWSLVGYRGSGCLNKKEFVIAMHLITLRRAGFAIPSSLPLLKTPAVLDTFPPMGQRPTTQWPVEPVSSTTAPGADPFGIPDPNFLDSPKAQGLSERVARSSGSDDKFKDRKGCTLQPEREEEAFFSDLVLSETERLNQRLRSISDSNDEISSDDVAQATRATETFSDITTGAKPGRQFKKSLKQLHKCKSPKSALRRSIDLDHQLKRLIDDSVTPLATEISGLTDSTASLVTKLSREKRELKKHIERRRAFEIQVAEAKLELDELQEARRKVVEGRLVATRDIEHLQSDILFLRQQIDIAAAELQQLVETNTGSERSLENVEQQNRVLISTRRSLLSSIEAEEEKLRQKEAEVASLRANLESVQDQKNQQRVKFGFLQEKQRQAEHDRLLLFRSVEAQHEKLSALQESRILATEALAQLTEAKCNTSNRPDGGVNVITTCPGGPEPLGARKDSKGIPASWGAPCSSPWGSTRSTASQSVQSIAPLREKFSSSSHAPPKWKTFDQQHDSAGKFATVVGIVDDRKLRGIHRLTNTGSLGRGSESSDVHDSPKSSCSSRTGSFGAAKSNRGRSSLVNHRLAKFLTKRKGAATVDDGNTELSPRSGRASANQATRRRGVGRSCQSHRAQDLLELGTDAPSFGNSPTATPAFPTSPRAGKSKLVHSLDSPLQRRTGTKQRNIGRSGSRPWCGPTATRSPREKVRSKQTITEFDVNPGVEGFNTPSFGGEATLQALEAASAAPYGRRGYGIH